jgi:hypothetical protein
VLERAEAHQPVENAKIIPANLSTVRLVDFQAVQAAGGRLAARKRYPDAGDPYLAHVRQKSAPPATEVEDPHPGLQPQTLDDETVLGALGLLQAQRESPRYRAPL